MVSVVNVNKQGRPFDVLAPFDSPEDAREYLVRWNWESGDDQDHFVKKDPGNGIVLASAFIVPIEEHADGRA